MCNVRLQASTLARKCDIYRWLPYGADGRVDVLSHVITNISGVWGYAYAGERARGATLLTNGIFLTKKPWMQRLLKENQVLLSFVFKVACTQTSSSRLEFVSREGASVHRLCSKHFFPLFLLLLLIVSWSKGTKSSLVYLLRGVISIINELLPCYSF